MFVYSEITFSLKRLCEISHLKSEGWWVKSFLLVCCLCRVARQHDQTCYTQDVLLSLTLWKSVNNFETQASYTILIPWVNATDSDRAKPRWVECGQSVCFTKTQLTFQKAGLWPTKTHQHVQKGSSGHQTGIQPENETNTQLCIWSANKELMKISFERLNALLNVLGGKTQTVLDEGSLLSRRRLPECSRPNYWFRQIIMQPPASIIWFPLRSQMEVFFWKRLASHGQLLNWVTVHL